MPKHKKNIIKKSKGVFTLLTPNIKNSYLELNFNPILEQINGNSFNNKNINSYLIHFQAKPKVYRQWGIYHINKDEYITCENIQFHRTTEIKPTSTFRTISLNESIHKTVPTSVLYISDGKLIKVEDFIYNLIY